MNDLLIFDCLESMKLIGVMKSTINSNIDTNPDGFNMVKNQDGFKYIQFCSRSFIRNFFSYVEGISFFMRILVLEAFQKGIIHLDNKIIAKMNEREFDELTDIIGKKNKFNSFKENLDLSFKQFAKAFGSDFQLDKRCVGWEVFNELLKVRNHITHPKNPQGYVLQEKTIKNMHNGALWFTESTISLINSCATSLDNKVRISEGSRIGE